MIAGFTMVSFYVKSLYTFVPLTETIDIILECVYNRKEISTALIEDEMKKLLTLCTKNVHFTLNNEIFVPNDGSIFMVEVENTLVPSFNQYVKKWRHYVDDTFAYVKKASIDDILMTLNSFHPNSSFTYEKENNNQLPLLDAFLIRNRTHVDTTVFQKDTHIWDLCLNWDTFTPISWKWGTLKTPVNRAYLVCSNNELLHKERAYLRSEILKKNGFSLRRIKPFMKEVQES